MFPAQRYPAMESGDDSWDTQLSPVCELLLSIPSLSGLWDMCSQTEKQLDMRFEGSISATSSLGEHPLPFCSLLLHVWVVMYSLPCSAPHFSICPSCSRPLGAGGPEGPEPHGLAAQTTPVGGSQVFSHVCHPLHISPAGLHRCHSLPAEAKYAASQGHSQTRNWRCLEDFTTTLHTCNGKVTCLRHLNTEQYIPWKNGSDHLSSITEPPWSGSIFYMLQRALQGTSCMENA